MTLKTVMQHPTLSRMVIMPESMGGYVETKRKAEASGFTVVPFARSTPPSGHISAEHSKRSAIMALPEARKRPSATATILADHNDLSVDEARAFLRGVPQEKPEQKAPTKMSSDPKAARQQELKSQMGAFNRAQGYAPDSRGRRATATSAADPVKLKRLAEIRLNALDSGLAHDQAGEAKKLRYALDVHGQTGLPLTNVFAQLGVDTSKLYSTEG